MNRWLGLTLVIIGFTEMIYWTCPELMSLLPGGAHEYDRLLANKLGFSLASLALFALATPVLGTFSDEPRTT
jgi:hypothetical protein